MKDRSEALRAFAMRLHEAIYSADRGATNPQKLAAALGGEPSASTIRSWLPPEALEDEAEGGDSEVATSTARNASKEPTEPRALLLAVVAEKLNVSVDWLLYGTDRQAVDLALVKRLRSLRSLHEDALTKEIGTQLADELVSLPLASELTRDVQLVTDEEHDVIAKEIRAILARAPKLVRELQEIEHRWKELRKRFPPTRTRRR